MNPHHVMTTLNASTPDHPTPPAATPRPACRSGVNAFSDVDASGDAARLLQYLDHADRGLRGPKDRLRAGFAARPGGRVLDLGCGAGHELVQLERDGFHAVGVDFSAAMVRSGRDRLGAEGHAARLAVADGARLPFPDGSFDGCRIERVLQHVPSPEAVLAEVRRTLRPGGAVAILEPDWASFTLAASDTEAARAVADSVGADIAHRDVGRRLRGLLVRAGFTEVRVEVELVVYASLEDLGNIISLDRAAARACADGRLDPARAQALLTEQRRLSEDGALHATLNRSVLAWARRPEGD